MGETWACLYKKKQDTEKKSKFKYQKRRNKQKMWHAEMVSKAQEKNQPQAGGGIKFH